MNRRHRWENFLDFDEPRNEDQIAPPVQPSLPLQEPPTEGPVIIARELPATSPDRLSRNKQNPESRRSDKFPFRALKWIIRCISWMTQDLKQDSQIGNIQDKPAEDSCDKLKTEPITPGVEAKPAATKSWLQKMLKSSFLKLSIVVIIVSALFSYMRNTPGDRKAYVASYALFELDHWDEIQRNASSLQNLVQSERFTNSDEIQASVQQFRHSFHRCRFLATVASKHLGTTIMRDIQEWVFRDNCTSALPITVGGGIAAVQEVLDCLDGVSPLLATTQHRMQAAKSADSQILKDIRAQYPPPLFSSIPSAQAEADEQRRRTTQRSLSILILAESGFVDITERFQIEKGRMTHLREDMRDLNQLVHQPQGDEIIERSEDWRQQVNRTVIWNCHEFDTPRLGDRFRAMALTVIGDDGQIQIFQSRYYPQAVDFDTKAGQ